MFPAIYVMVLTFFQNPLPATNILEIPQKVSSPNTFIVNTTSDQSSGGGMSLRAAISAANNNPGPDFIHFNIPGTGPHRIAHTNLPMITEQVTIDGTTQPGWSGTPLIELDGQDVATFGLYLTTDSSTIRGLAIGNNLGANIKIEGSNNTIQQNYLGRDANGNYFDSDQAIYVTGDHNLVGGAGLGNWGFNWTGNLIVGNHNQLFGNTLESGGAGTIFGDYNVIGSFDPGMGNTFTGHQGFFLGGNHNLLEGNHFDFELHGVSIQEGIGNTVRRNLTMSGAANDVELLLEEGNDPLDLDMGANNLQNYPTIASIETIGDNTIINAHLGSAPLTTFDVDIYSGIDCYSGTNGSTRHYLGSANVTTDEFGDVLFSYVAPSDQLMGPFVSMTATDPDGNTSAMGYCNGERIFEDGFDSGDTSAWTSSMPQNPLVLPEAAYNRSLFGLRVHLDDGPTWVSDASPDENRVYRAQFSLNIDGLDVGSGDRIKIFSGVDDTYGEQMLLEIGHNSGQDRLYAAIDTILGIRYISLPLESGWNVIEVLWSLFPNGGLNLWVNGERTGTGPEPHTWRRLDSAALGFLGQTGSTSQGYIDIDAFIATHSFRILKPDCLRSIFQTMLPDWGVLTVLDLLEEINLRCGQP